MSNDDEESEGKQPRPRQVLPLPLLRPPACPICTDPNSHKAHTRVGACKWADGEEGGESGEKVEKAVDLGTPAGLLANAVSSSSSSSSSAVSSALSYEAISSAALRGDRDTDLSTVIPLYSAILLQCAACSHIIRRPEDLQLHALLGVPTCKLCARNYSSGEFERFQDPDDDHEIYCRCCGDGGDLLLCDLCPRSFCRDCVWRLVGHDGTDAINASDEWTCFACDPAPIETLKRCGKSVHSAVKFYAPPPPPPPTRKRRSRKTATRAGDGGAKGAASGRKGAKRQRAARGGRGAKLTSPAPAARSLAKWTILKDIALGREGVAIPVINEVDDERPPQFTYVSKNVEGDAGVRINRNPNFVCRCDCVGNDCITNKNCACAKLNVNGIPRYDRRRRLVSMPAVVYECNYLCGCHAHKCKNRVVGLGVQLNLEVFKTGKCGWGVRCTTAIEAGTFVCEYAGELVSESTAESRVGRDQYLLDLDAARIDREALPTYRKEGYEAKVVPVGMEDTAGSPRMWEARIRKGPQGLGLTLKERSAEGAWPHFLDILNVLPFLALVARSPSGVPVVVDSGGGSGGSALLSSSSSSSFSSSSSSSSSSSASEGAVDDVGAANTSSGTSDGTGLVEKGNGEGGFGAGVGEAGHSGVKDGAAEAGDGEVAAPQSKRPRTASIPEVGQPVENNALDPTSMDVTSMDVEGGAEYDENKYGVDRTNLTKFDCNTMYPVHAAHGENGGGGGSHVRRSHGGELQDRRDVLEKAGVTITKGARHHYTFTFAATPAVPDIRTFYSLTSAEEYFHTLHKDGAPPSLNLAGGQGAIEEGSRNKSRRRTTNRSDRRRRRRRSSFGWPS